MTVNRHYRATIIDRLAHTFFAGCALLTALLFIGIILQIGVVALPVLSAGVADSGLADMDLLTLLFGSVKGALYAMLIAVPLALLSAIYTSYFMSDEMRAFIKPAIELIASIPPVIIGLVGVLWFTPFLRQHLLGFVIALVFVPVIVFGFVWFLSRLKNRVVFQRICLYNEFVVVFPLLILGFVISFEIGHGLEIVLFDGNFVEWLNRVGPGYTPQNTIVVAFCLGLAVIPYIFHVAEDVLSSVPRNLVAASLALGANRWQTVSRTVIPTAIPGLLAAVLVGFSRAIGDTIIILMVANNLPLHDWGPFSGLRTLTTHIALEINETSSGTDLYHALFWTGFLVLLITLITNTIASFLRNRLKIRYERFS